MRHLAPKPIAFPHASAVDRALGTTSAGPAVHDPHGCAARSTKAFTAGATAHFADAHPDLHVAAHEAVHQLQHAGVTNDAGLGAEGQAIAAARAVRSGRPASHLIGTFGTRIPSAVRHYVGEGTEHLADTGETLTFNTHDAYATPALIQQAAGILKARNSGISLSAGAATRLVEAPDHSGSKTLSQVAVKMDIDPTGEKFFGDCQQAAAEVMGGKGMDASASAVVKGSAGETSVPLQRNPLDTVPLVIYVEQEIKKNPDYPKYGDEEKRKFVAEKKRTFELMTPKEVERLRKIAAATDTSKMGADEHALPAAGEAFAIFPERPPATGSGKFNYHFATVVMVTGTDRVTFENAGGDRAEKTPSWSFRTYGTKEGQSFHEQWSRVFHGATTTLVIRNLPQTPTDIGTSVAKPTAALIALHDAAPPESRFYLKRELDTRPVSGTIQVVKQDDYVGADEPFLQFGAGSTFVSTAHPHIKEGASGTVTMTAGRLLPASNPMTVRVMEYDLLRDDRIGTITWPSPYGKVTTTVTDGGAKYVVTLSL